MGSAAPDAKSGLPESSVSQGIFNSVCVWRFRPFKRYTVALILSLTPLSGGDYDRASFSAARGMRSHGGVDR